MAHLLAQYFDKLESWLVDGFDLVTPEGWKPSQTHPQIVQSQGNRRARREKKCCYKYIRNKRGAPPKNEGFIRVHQVSL